MIKRIFIVLICIFFIVILYSSGLYIPCPIHLITGLHCPGCGITRCIVSIIKLEFYQAFRYNPLIFILLPFLISYVLYKIYIWILYKEDRLTNKLSDYPMYILIVILISYGILRNISYFSWLAPTEIH